MARTAPEPNWQSTQPGTARALAWMQRRIVALGGAVDWHDRSKAPCSYLFTGFVVDFHDQLFWVTAGHCIRQLQEIVEDRSVRAAPARWYDQHPLSEAASIPAVIMDREWHFSFRNDLDLGVLPLSELEMTLVRANPNIDPFRLPAVEPASDAHGEGVFVVGYPIAWRSESFQSSAGKGVVQFAASPVAVPVVEDARPLKSDISAEFWRREDCHYLRVALDAQPGQRALDSIVGLSGGPVVMLRRGKDGTLSDTLIGVQSSWLPDQRVIRVELVQRIVEFLEFRERRLMERSLSRSPL